MKGVHQFVENSHALFFGDIGDMGVAGGGIGVGMTK